MPEKKLKPGLFLKKSPFLFVKVLNNNDVRVYSKLHGNLTSYNFDINKILNIFDYHIDIETAANKVSEIYQLDPYELINELYEKSFLIEGSKNEKDMLLEYVETVKNRNKTPKISNVTFLISAKCNLACKGCYHNFFDFKSSDMDAGFAGQILEDLFPYLKKNKIPELLISFLGYEPFLNFETLKSIYDQACIMGEKYNIKTLFQIFTNAFDLSKDIYEWIELNKFRLGIKISLDGIKEDNDKRRVDFSGKGTYDRVIGNLRRIIMTDVESGVLIVLSKLNFANIETFVDEMARIGIKNITANIFCGQSSEERLMELTEMEKFEAIKRLDLATEKLGIDFNGEWKFAVVQMITGAHFFCPAGIKQLVFSPDGSIYPCQRFAGTEINFGTYKSDFWEKLIDCKCEGYNNWVADFYNSIKDRTKEEDIDLTGWSCPFIPFLRGEYINRNLERELNEKLLEYYITRPLNRILAKTPMDCSNN